MATWACTWPRHIRASRATIVRDDMYVGNLITALGCIDAGITCIIDNSHNSRSAAHSDSAVQALIDSGIRSGARIRGRRSRASGTSNGRRILRDCRSDSSHPQISW